MIKYVYMVTGQQCFDSDDKIEEEVFGLYSTKEKAEKLANKKREEKDILNHKIWDYVFVDKVELDREG
jgi:hypothetical protein